MSVRRAILVAVSCMAAAAGCGGGNGTKDAGADEATLPDIVFDPGPTDVAGEEAGPVDPGIGDLAPEQAEETTGEGVEDPGTQPDDAAADVAPPLAGTIELAPYTVEFGYVQAGSSARRQLQIRNSKTGGPGDLRVDSIRMTGSMDFLPELAETPKTTGETREWKLSPARVLAAGETWTLPIDFRPTADEEAQSQVEVISSDTDRPAGPPKAFLRANQVRACLEVVPQKVDFQFVVVGESVSSRIRVVSCGGLDVEVRGIALDDAGTQAGLSLDFAAFPGGVAPSPQAPVTIAAGESAEFTVAWAPTPVPPETAVPMASLVTLIGNQFPGATFLSLSGTALPGRCTLPRVGPAEPSSVLACTLLQSSGADSFSFFGPLTEYAWTLSQPDGGGASLVPDATRVDVSAFACLPGDYTFGLRVRDSAGYDACGEATRTVKVMYDTVAAMVLTWRYADGTPIGAGTGPNLDLHVLHMSAPAGDDGWFDSKYDGYAQNPTPNVENLWNMWNDSRNRDGAYLASQSADGMLPEAFWIDTSACPATRYFRFGVFYPPEDGTKNVLATLTAYAYNQLGMQREVELRPGDLWDAGRLTCGATTPISEVAGPRVVHDFVPSGGAAAALRAAGRP